MRAERIAGRATWEAARSEAVLDWNAVYTEALPRLYNFFRYRVGNDLVAEDLTSTTFEKAWRKRGSYRSEMAGVITWLFAIARNVANDYYRRTKTVLYFEEIYLQVDEHGLSSDPGDGPEEHAQRAADFSRLSTLLRKLTTREQELVALKYGAGLTNREIARLTGLSESNVGTIASRIVARLRAEWEVDG